MVAIETTTSSFSSSDKSFRFQAQQQQFCVCELPLCLQETPSVGICCRFLQVCGSDGKNYSNECELKKAACDRRELVSIQNHGPCAGWCIAWDRCPPMIPHRHSHLIPPPMWSSLTSHSCDSLCFSEKQRAKMKVVHGHLKLTPRRWAFSCVLAQRRELLGGGFKSRSRADARTQALALMTHFFLPGTLSSSLGH